MFGSTYPASPDGPLVLLFAKEPDHDLELEEAESDRPPSAGPPKREKPPASRALVWALLLVIVAGGAYVLLDPDILMKVIGPEPVSAPPRPVPSANRTPKLPSAPPPGSENPNPALAPASVPVPAFAEGQPVTVRLDGASPDVSLSADPAGSNPGPAVRPGSVLVVVDAEFQNTGWVYQLRTEDGSKGWIAEKRLAAKP